jgi:hypothetical protein
VFGGAFKETLLVQTDLVVRALTGTTILWVNLNLSRDTANTSRAKGREKYQDITAYLS